MKIDTAIPPRYRRNLNKSSFVCMGHKETAASIFSKPPFPIGVLIGLLHDGFFSFAVVRQLDNRLFLFLRIIIKSKCHRNVRAALIFDRKTS